MTDVEGDRQDVVDLQSSQNRFASCSRGGSMIAAVLSLLFWPALVLALGLSILGISHRAPLLLGLAALLTVPASLYIGLGGELRGGVLIALLPLFPAMG